MRLMRVDKTNTHNPFTLLPERSFRVDHPTYRTLTWLMWCKRWGAGTSTARRTAGSFVSGSTIATPSVYSPERTESGTFSLPTTG